MRQMGFLLWSICAMASAAPFVINSAGEKVVGVAIAAAPDGTIQLTTQSGQTLTFRAGSYRSAFAEKPAEIARAEALVKCGQLEEGAALLRRAKRDYHLLGWGPRASLMLARLYGELEQFDDAAREYEALFDVQPALRDNLNERSRYMRALLGCGRIEAASRLIDADIASGSRAAAAHAQVLRGDLNAAEGEYAAALLDYLRTVLLFRAQVEVLPEATYKVAQTLQALHDSRAATYFQKTIDEFPQSKWARRAREALQ